MTNPYYTGLLETKHLVNFYQPIVDLKSGKILAVEVLGRLVDDGKIIPPDVFLPTFSLGSLERLLFLSLTQGLEALKTCRATHPNLGMTFNVSPRVMVRNRFFERIEAATAGEYTGRITLEILEQDDFLNFDQARKTIDRLRAIGIKIALDDVGTGYSSLIRLQSLPVDYIKLDQAFVRNLKQNPEGLHFVSAMICLSKGLRMNLVVEGVETAEIMQTLSVLGVEAAQGYAIARPMPEAKLLEWLAGYVEPPVVRELDSMLGAYAAHLNIVDACRAIANHPSRLKWTEDICDPHKCAIGHFFDKNGLHDGDAGKGSQKLSTRS